MTRTAARSIANSYAIPLDRDYHTLDSDSVRRIVSAADSVSYRAPRNANGSRARYFHARLCRAANRKEG
jgi:hypothetical protein